MRRLLVELGFDAGVGADEVVLVCRENFANRPTATMVDVRRQLGVLERQFSRMARLETILASLPAGLSFDLAVDADGTPTRPAGELRGAVSQVGARFTPDCLGTC